MIVVKKNKQTKEKHLIKEKNRQTIHMYEVLVLMVTAFLVLLVYWRFHLLYQIEDEIQTEEELAQHYVMISDSGNSTFWNHVYEGAAEYGKESSIYIERMEESTTENYSKEELMEIAVYSKVDGILLEGDESSVQKELIDRAEEAGIPVVTMLNDNYGSERQTFVGLGNYNLGREYAREVIKIATEDTSKVLILGEKMYEGTAHNIILNGFSDTIQNEGNHLKVETEVVLVNGEDSFSAQETIREILFDENRLPDIIICLNEVNTVNVYQAVVDYNMVGKIKIIGYYLSDTILRAIGKQVIDSTIVFDAKQMGRTAVAALEEYEKSGYVSDYITLEAEVIDQNNYEEYLKNEQKSE